MNEKDVMNLLNSIDDDLVDKKVDDLLREKGETFNIHAIKEKAMNKLNKKPVKKSKINRKTVIAAAVAATLTFSTVYAGEISKAIQSFFNKSVLYSTIVDGDAYYLPREVKLNDKFTLLNLSVSKGHLDAAVKPSAKLVDKQTEGLNVSVIPMNDPGVRYTVGGYGYDADGVMQFSFMNETENNYNIAPFKDFKFTIDGVSYDISLEKADNLKTDASLIVGKPHNENVGNDETPDELTPNYEQTTPLIANVAGIASVKDGKTNIQLVASFEDEDLILRNLGEPEFTEFKHSFKNENGGILGSGTSGIKKPITAYDKNNNPYTLNEPENAVGRPITLFETTANTTDLTVKLPAVSVGYEKIVTETSLTIPKEGEVSVNKELDFIIQKANVKSIKRVSEDTAVVEFDLNTGKDKSVWITDIGAYSKDVIKAETIIKDNTATMTMTFDKNLEKVDFRFSWPSFVIRGNWLIELGADK